MAALLTARLTLLLAAGMAAALLLVGGTASAQILSFNTTVTINYTTTFHSYLFGDVVINLLATPINSSYVNITVVARGLTNGSGVPADFLIYETQYNTTTNSIGVAAGVGWINLTGGGSGVASRVVLWSPEANTITWNVIIGGNYFPGKSHYFVVPVVIPITTPPTAFAAAAPLLFLAMVIGLAGRHKARDAAMGLIAVAVFGVYVFNLLGLGVAAEASVTAVSILLGVLILVLARKQ